MNRLIQLVDLSLYFNEKICFEAFHYAIHSGERIALIGDNGSGKSSMLKIIKKLIQPSDGLVHYSNNATVAYVPQLIDCYEASSGAEKFNHALTQALALDPEVLLLDEPTNHLDKKNRASLLRLLEQYQGTLILASHDVHLLRNNDYCFWFFNQGTIEIFHGSYDHFQQKKSNQVLAIEAEINQIKRQKKATHHLLMKEQTRAKNSRLKGEKSIKEAKWPTIVSNAKAVRAQETSGRIKKALSEEKEHLIDRLNDLGREDEIKHKFELPVSTTTTKALVTISEGLIAYNEHVILSHINLNLSGQSRLAICGANGSGKSTLLNAIMGNEKIRKEGLWICPNPRDIGYLDQHYQQLNNCDSVLETIQKSRPDWIHTEIRLHLNSFLFRKNEQINSLVSELSGGEKARLSLAVIAAKPPKLLILDELTNNLDLKTRNHVITLLKEYPGPFIVISHDDDFLQHLGITEKYNV